MSIHRMYAKSACVITLFGLLTLPARADYPDRYVGTGILYIDADSDASARGVDVDDGGGLQLILGQTLGSASGLEFNVFLNDLSVARGHRNNFYQGGLGIDFLWYFQGRKDGFTPFALAGLGAVRNDPPSPVDDDSNAFVNLGLGFMSKPFGSSGIRVRGDLRYVKDNFEDQPDDLRVGLAMVFPYGQTKEVVRTEVREVEVVREVVREKPQADSDGDGVVDGVDRCPNTLRGAQVDQYGCAIKQVVTLEGVHFEYNSARLTPDSMTILDKVAETLQGQPSMEVEIAGHCSSEGSDAYNQRLSERRADSVRNYLVDRGVAASRLRAVGYGESRPVASNETESGRSKNRRVEFHILRQ
ncbi:MAG TPA: OmpA family protein [Nevskiales bacterium]|nr:OmpA family protein [Nevskiales bacterium]